MLVAGFRSLSFSRNDQSGPEVKLTVRQLSLPAHGISPIPGGQGTEMFPACNFVTDRDLIGIDLMDKIDLEYGASLDSVAFIDRLNYVSPFARLNYRCQRIRDAGGWIQFRRASGGSGDFV